MEEIAKAKKEGELLEFLELIRLKTIEIFERDGVVHPAVFISKWVEQGLRHGLLLDVNNDEISLRTAEFGKRVAQSTGAEAVTVVSESWMIETETEQECREAAETCTTLEDVQNHPNSSRAVVMTCYTYEFGVRSCVLKIDSKEGKKLMPDSGWMKLDCSAQSYFLPEVDHNDN